jgi:hypothetical protein
VVDLNAVGDGVAHSLSALNPFGTDQGNKQAGTDGQNSGPQTPLGRATKLTPKSLTDGFTPLKPRSSKADNQIGRPVATVGANIGSIRSVRMWKRPSKKPPTAIPSARASAASIDTKSTMGIKQIGSGCA